VGGQGVDEVVHAQGKTGNFGEQVGEFELFWLDGAKVWQFFLRLLTFLLAFFVAAALSFLLLLILILVAALLIIVLLVLVLSILILPLLLLFVLVLFLIFLLFFLLSTVLFLLVAHITIEFKQCCYHDKPI
jgi:hypothetical protein